MNLLLYFPSTGSTPHRCKINGRRGESKPEGEGEGEGEGRSEERRAKSEERRSKIEDRRSKKKLMVEK